jgi:hypothetical protein
VFGGFGSVGRGGVGGGSGVPGGVGVVCIRIPVIILLFSEIIVGLVRFNHVARCIVNADHCRVRVGVGLRVTDSARKRLESPERALTAIPSR